MDFRAELFNVFNHAAMPDSNAARPLATQAASTNGQTPSGFGMIDVNNIQVGTERTGQLVLRIGF